MLASSMMNADPDDRRDATYVRVRPLNKFPFSCLKCLKYVLLADINAKYKHIAPRFEPVTFYGQLQHICVVKLPLAPELKLKKEETLILAAVRRCEIEAKNDLDMHHYRKEGGIEVVDMSTIQCLVGRLQTTDKKHWVVIDRSGDLARPYYDPDD